MTEQWQELKETITEMRDSNGTCTQQEVCKFLVNYMEILEKQMQEPTTHGYMLVCPNCGLDVHSDFESCPRCGEKMKVGE